MKELDQEQKLLLMGFCCSFAWADMELHPSERAAILKLVDRLHIDERGKAKVQQWLKSPPPPDDLDPYAIPKEARADFLAECEAIIRADGVVHPEETETMSLLTRVLFGDAAAARRRLARAAAEAAGETGHGHGHGHEDHHHDDVPGTGSTKGKGKTMAAKKGKNGNGEGSDKKAIVEQLNKILQMELAGVSRYLHYSFMVFGHNRIPIVSFFRGQATEGMQHAVMVGEKITAYGAHPTIRIDNPPEGGKHDVRSMLTESLEFERRGVALYRELLDMCGGDIALEELTRSQISAEPEHCEEVEKMLRDVPR